MQTDQAFGLAHFIAQTDAVGLALFVVLLAMSVLSWTVILRKARQVLIWKCAMRAFATQPSEPRTWSALVQEKAGPGLAEQVLKQALLAPPAMRDAALAHAIDHEASRMESGQTCLASVASSAPFVGLFGTVWGIYHALVSIAATGQSSLDQVAGPVGEALIMTALGLAVAIPAALAYNAFQRLMRTQLAGLERLAHEFSMHLNASETAQGG